MHKARKRFGQNFLIDKLIIERIVATIAPKKADNLLEIGAGKGAITLPLLAKLTQLHVLEIDHDLITLLRSFKQNNLIIHQEDVLKFKLSSLPTPLRIVGNLPYNISSAILFHLLPSRAHIIDMIFMLQKEVVERMVAVSGNKIYGRLSVMIQAFFEVEMLFVVPPESFEPAPKVNSAIVYLKPRKNPLVNNLPMFEKIVKAGFSKRRKTLRNCLKSMLTQAQTEVDLSHRAEMLNVADFVQLTKDYEKQH